MNITEHGVTVINPEKGTDSDRKGFDGYICSLEGKETDLDAQDEDQAIHADRTHGIQGCVSLAGEIPPLQVNNYPDEYCPPMPLPVHPDCIKNLGKGVEKAEKGILPPSRQISRPTTRCQLNSSRQYHRHQTFHHPRHHCRVLSLSR